MARTRSHFFPALAVALLGIAVYTVLDVYLAAVLLPMYQSHFNPTHDVFYVPSHMGDARQYVYICAQGYSLPGQVGGYPPFGVLPTSGISRVNWMPVYALLQCGLHHLAGVSLVFTGPVISALAVGLALFLGTLTLGNLGVRGPALHALAALVAPVGAAWLYLAGVEATYLAMSMIVLWLITLPPPADTPRGRSLELIQALIGLPVGLAFILTKPNALDMLLPLSLAFFYLSWKRSGTAGYQGGLATFAADVVIEHLRPVLALVQRIRRQPLELEPRPVRYCWTPLLVMAGIALGLAYWLVYTSDLSGVPFYFWQQQSTRWQYPWGRGNLPEMVEYFAQAFRVVTVDTPWRYSAAWFLAAMLVPLVPASSPRVPGLMRGMLLAMTLFYVISGSIRGQDRYVLSAALVVVGWGCWLAPTGKQKRWSALRWLLVIALAAITSYLMVVYLFPTGQPYMLGIQDR